MEGIITEARALRERSLVDVSTETAASGLWSNLHKIMHAPMIGGVDQVKAFTAFLTEENAFTFPRKTDDPECEKVCRKLIDHLDGIGEPVASFPANVEESSFAGDKVVFQHDGRRVSAAFLFQICKARRIDTLVPDIESVLEIGAGYGGLARTLRLLKPRRQHIIVDLPDSLFCSYVFLAANFPEATRVWIVDASDASKIDDYEFVFVPAHLVDLVQGRSVDLALNTASLGEMTDVAVKRYMELIHGGARHFYSHNRYGRRDPLCSPDQTRSAVVLDAGWDVLFWDLWGASGFGQAEPATPPSLELMVKRRTEAPADFALAAAYFQLASHEKIGTSRWHYFMWNSIRIFPTKMALATYLAEIERTGEFNEVSYYQSKLSTAPDVDLSLPDGLALPAVIEEVMTPSPRPSRWGSLFGRTRGDSSVGDR